VVAAAIVGVLAVVLLAWAAHKVLGDRTYPTKWW
jgi:hypothetical protein